jgi:hypothetical protein
MAVDFFLPFSIEVVATAAIAKDTNYFVKIFAIQKSYAATNSQTSTPVTPAAPATAISEKNYTCCCNLLLQAFQEPDVNILDPPPLPPSYPAYEKDS